MEENVTSLIPLPDFKIADEDIPDIRVKSIRFQNYLVFENYKVDLIGDDGKPVLFSCFFGPNGCGKTTILNALQLIFSRFEGYDKRRLKVHLGKSVRTVDGKKHGIYGKDDFVITAEIQSSIGNYEIEINKSGFVKDHPDKIKNILYRLCFSTRFDMELDKFQLERSQWDKFKDLFEAVTGFEIEEQKNIFDSSEDPVQAEIMRKYVLGFWVHKPDETIARTECSAGERKIIKSFSTLLNKEYHPKIILVDNVAMHVETGRHLNLINAMKRCFPGSQIFSTTHSYQISKNFGERNQLFDLRIIKACDIVKKEPWRLYIADEIEDSISQLRSLTTIPKRTIDNLVKKGDKIAYRCLHGKSGKTIPDQAQAFLQKVSELFIKDIIKYHSDKR